MLRIGRLVFVAALLLSARANADTILQTNLNANGFRIFNPHTPTLATDVLTLGFATPGNCILQSTAVNGSIVCSTLTLTMSGPLTCDAGSSCDLSANRTFGLTIDSTLTSGATLGRAAITGPVAVAGGSNVSTVGTNVITNSNLSQMPAATVKANATNATADAQDVGPTAAGQVFTAVTLSTLGWATQTTATLGVTAEWPVLGVRIFCLDPINGNDANAGFADSADRIAGNIATATAACGAVAKKTFTALVSIIPPLGPAHQWYAVIRGGAYTDNPALLDRAKGYNAVVIRGTDTNTTAGVTAFDGSNNDLIFQGATTGTGMNAAGYNPTTSATSDTVSLALVGGGSPSFAAEPAKPLGLRFRCDVATTTAALRNKVLMVAERVDATTIRLDSSITFTTSDVCYLEQPGVYFNSFIPSFTGGNNSMVFNGIRFLGFTGNLGAYSFAFCASDNNLVGAGNRLFAALNMGGIAPNLVIGPTRIELATVVGSSGNASFAPTSFVTGTTFAATGLNSLAFQNFNVVGTNATITGGGMRSDQTPASQQFGATGGFGPTEDKRKAPRVLGTMTFNGTKINLGTINFPSTTQAHAIIINGTNDLDFQYGLFGGPTTDAAFDISQSTGSRIKLIPPWIDPNNSPHITGTNGDVYAGTSPTIGSVNIYSTFNGLTQNAGVLELPNGDKWITVRGPSFTGSQSYAYQAAVSQAVAAENRSGADIPADPNGVGYLVRFGPNGFNGTDRVEIAIAQGDSLAHVSGGIGQAVGPIKNGTSGFVVIVGGALTYVGSDPLSGGYGQGMLWLSDTVAGKVTHFRPAPPSVALRVGWSIGETQVSFQPDLLPLYYDTFRNGSTDLTQRTRARCDGTTIVCSDDGANYWTNLSVGAIPESSVTGLTADLAAKITDPGSNGILARTGTSTVTPRTITNSDGTITITNGNGVAGNPVISRPAISGDGTIAGGSNTFALNNIPTGTTQAGTILQTGISAPSSPASGNGSFYFDSTALNGAVKNASGTVNHMAQTFTASAHQFATALSDAGAWTTSQPAFTDVSGSLSCAQLPSLTGDVTSSGCAATIASHAVTSAKFRQSVANTLVGNATGSTADVTDITLGAGCSFSGGALTCPGTGVPTTRTISTTSPLAGGGALSGDLTLSLNYDSTTVTLNGSNQIQVAAETGDVTKPAGSNVQTIAANAVTTAKILDANVTRAKLSNSDATSVIGRSANSAGVPADIDCTADGNVVWRSGTTLGCSALDYAKLTGTPTSLAPSGAAGGDLGSTYPNPTVVAGEFSGSRYTFGAVSVGQLLTLSGTTIQGVTRTINTTSGQLTGGGTLGADLTLGLADWGSPGTWGGTGKYIREIVTEAKGRVSYVDAVDIPASTTYKWSISAKPSPWFQEDSKNVAVLGDTGTIDNAFDVFTASPGDSIDTAVGAVVASTPLNLYSVPSTHGGGGIFYWQPSYVVGSGSGTGTMEASIWKISGGLPGTFTQLCAVTNTIGTGSGSLAQKTCSFGTSVAASDLIFVAMRRTDSNASLIVTTFATTATLELLR